jgi:hypothetical protein
MDMSLNPQSTGLVIELQQGLDLSSVGAKSANLGKAIENGSRVPPGFVVTRQALSLFLEQSGFVEDLQPLLDRPAGLSHSERTEAHQAFCQKLLATPIPQLLIDAVAPFADALFDRATCGLAVRSSSIYEDSATASFAGVYESFLGIHSLEVLWASIQKCWCSAWAPLALDYAHKMGIESEPDGMAVLVQPLLAADSAGVLFTADPRTGNPWRFVLESTFGLAQELVGTSGPFAADRFVFKWDTGRIVTRHIAEKSMAWVPGSTGIEKVALPAERQRAPSLPDETARRIARTALEIDRAFACRVDIEWVVAADQIYVVQVRPITALPDFFPHHLPHHVRDKTWRLVQHWHFPHRLIEGKLMPPLYRDLLIAEQFARYRRVGPIELPPNCYAGAEMDLNGHRYALEAGNDWLRWTAESKERYLAEFEPRIRQDYLDGFQHRFPAMGERAAALEQEARTVAARIDALLWARDASFDALSLHGGHSQVLSAVCDQLLRGFLTTYRPDCTVEELLQGHHPDIEPYFPEVQVAHAERLAEALGADRRTHMEMDMQDLVLHLAREDLNSPFVRAFEDYCTDVGLVPPSRFTDPQGAQWQRYTEMLHMVRAALKKPGRTVQAMQEQVARRREASVAAARQRLSREHPDQVQRFERLLDWAFFWGPALNNRGWLGGTLDRLGHLVAVLCRGLRDDGLVDVPEEIGYFTAADLAHIAQTLDIEEGRRIWRQRRCEYERDDRLRPPPYLGKAPAEPATQAAPAAAEEDSAPTGESASRIQGTGAVAGKNSGIARKIESLGESDRVGAEHVLLFAKDMQFLAGHTPMLFSLTLRVRGMVCPSSSFGLMYHLAQIARECGVPIVLVSPADMRRIPEGAELELDGSQGTVTIR